MNISRIFIDRPIFAGVLSVLVALIGAFAYFILPVAQYPEIAPPQIVVSAQFPGATPEVLADTIATPLEQQINGVKDMLYMSSSATSDGAVAITVTFRLGTNLDTAQVLVQNRVATATPRLPQTTRDLGVTVRQSSAGFLGVVSLYSPDGSLDTAYVGNYANASLRDRLLRVPGVGDIQTFGGGDYSMRIWLDPERVAARGLTSDEVVAALRAQNTQVSAGSVNGPPFAAGAGAYTVNITAQGRLTSPAEFEDVVVRTDTQGRITRLRDVARVELGKAVYATQGYFNGKPCVSLGITQQPGSNALAGAKGLQDAMKEASKGFPQGLAYGWSWQPTNYIAASVHEVEITLLIAIVLVVVVVVVFLQSWRAAIIPVLAIPVSLLGALGVLAAFHYSLNTLSLFGLVLAIGIVVDDAIVVVEDIERNLEEGLSPRDAAYKSMEEVSGALVAIGLVLCAVFIPTALISGISGEFYRQFAVTIASATVFSVFVSLTLTPALGALLLKPKTKGRRRGWTAPIGQAADLFNKGFDRTGRGYGRVTARLVRTVAPVLIVYAVLLALTGWRFGATPGGFIPNQDQGFLIGVVQLPPGSALNRTSDVMVKAIAEIRKQEGVATVTGFAGLDGATFSQAPNAGTMFINLDDAEALKKKHLTSEGVGNAVRGATAALDAFILFIQPPPVPGIGNGAGFKMILQNKGGSDYATLDDAAKAMMGAAQKEKAVAQVFTTFNRGTPRVEAHVDRQKAETLGVDVGQVFSTMQTYLGSQYVNDFNFLGRTYQVNAQADAAYRRSIPDIANLRTRSSSGGMVPLGAVTTFEDGSGPVRVVRYNVFPAVELQGSTPPGFSTGQSLDAMETLAQHVLPRGVGYEWTELAFQEKAAGNTAILAFGAAVLFVFLLLAAQYESFTLPLAVILIVPMCLLAAVIGVNIRGMDNNILTQIGFVVLVGLAAKNAILIVEFARQAEQDLGMTPVQAAEHAARQRLRPILMTSLAFILGVFPLVIAEGPGREMRQALGTAVFFGMLGVTAFGLLFTPTFYVVARWLGAKLPQGRASRARDAKRQAEGGAPPAGEPGVEPA